MSRIAIDIWSDLACPWCYVGKRRLEAALTRFPNRDAVDITWHAFELDPRAPAVRDPQVAYAERLAKKYGTTVPAAEAMMARVTQTAAEDGLELRFDRARGGNTFDAHRVIALAGTLSPALQGAVEERLFRAMMTEGEALGDRDTLVRLAGEAGLDAEHVRAMLASDAFTNEVRSDEHLARELGIDGVPFFVVDGKYGVSGAQPADVLLGILDRAWAELPNEGGAKTVDDLACDVDGCA